MINLKHTTEFIGSAKKNEEDFYACLRLLVNQNQTDKEYTCKNEDPHWMELSERYLSVKSQLAELEQLEEQYKKELIRLAEDKNCEGAGLKLTKIVRKGNVKYKEIPELQDIDLEQYRSDPIETWRIQEEEKI